MKKLGEIPIHLRRRIFGLPALTVLSAAALLCQACGGGSSAVPSVTSGLVAIKISPAISFLPLAGTRQLVATGIYNDGSQQDLTLQVAWSASSLPSATSNVSVDPSSGVATGMTVGPSVVSARLGPVLGLLQLLVTTNGYSSNTTGILVVPFGKTEVDAAYAARSQSPVQGAYEVQEVNLDADQFSNVIPVPAALIASIPMPSGFVPNATAASQKSLKVAVISYTSPEVQVIDASNDPADPTSNTVIATYTAPISQSVTFNGTPCMICAALVNPSVANPLTDQLILSTAQGYYAMDLNSGTFAALTPMACPAPSFTLNPIATQPYILSPNPGQTSPPDANCPSEVQTLNLVTNSVTSSAFGLNAPNAAAIDLATGYAAVVDAGANDQALLNLGNPQNPVPNLVPNLCPFSSSCRAKPPCTTPASGFNMVAIGVSASANSATVSHTLLLSDTSGNCVGVERWPNGGSNASFPSNATLFGYLPMPATPDGNAFINGNDPNAIGTFASAVDKNTYGLLVDGNPSANQSWIAKINLPALIGILPSGVFLPTGLDIFNSFTFLTGHAGDPVVYLPTPGSVVTLSQASINFGQQPVGFPTAPSLITLTNTSTINSLTISQLAIQGTNAGDFAEVDNCIGALLPQGKCTINVGFSPSAAGSRSATLSITDDGGASPQTVSLSGTGT
jgi:hypothetical protein